MDEDLINQSFDEAIRAFAGRTDVVTKPRFLALDEAARARAWTMARVADADVLTDMHAAVEKIIAEGGGFRDFVDSIEETMEKRGWEGPQAWHAQLVFNQNVGMAHTAGRFSQAQAAGVQHWRYLASDAAEPREEHKPFYNQVYPMGDGPMPPLDFGCACSWEVVFDDEIEPGTEIQDPAGLVPEGQEFQFKPAEFFRPLELDLSDYPPEIQEALKRAAANDPQLKLVLRGA